VRRAALPLLVLAAVVALGWNLGGYPLLDPDEGRNAEVAREMAVTNDYLVPHLDGLPYLDKPVLYFAAAAALMELLGPTETAARLPAYVFTLATLALVGRYAARRWGRDAAWLAALACATLPLTLVYAHTVIFDSALACFTTAAILCFRDDRPVLAWAAMALGALTKGPVALAVPLCAVVPWALVTGVPARRFAPPRALAVFAVVALPWFVAVSLRHPEFPHYALVRETFERFTTASFRRTAPLWYYLPIVAVAAFPWIVPGLARLSCWRWAWRARRVNAHAREAWFLACWVLGPALLFTLNRSKLPQYVLPLMPAIALAAARVLTREGIAAAWRGAAGLLAAVGAVLMLRPRFLTEPLPLTAAQAAAIPGAAVAVGVALVAAAALVAFAAHSAPPRLTLGLAGYALPVITLPFATGPLLSTVGDDRSAAAIAQAITGSGAGDAVLAVLAYPPSLPFYLRRTVPVSTADARELTSNYIAAYHDRLRALPGSPLLPSDSWRDVLARCAVPTVFVTHDTLPGPRLRLREALPLIADNGRYSAYGPCRPHPLAPSPQRGEGERG
jgi:4-amino-4-deoxy-L-arabinose transferase-like glycosyltransferase